MPSILNLCPRLVPDVPRVSMSGPLDGDIMLRTTEGRRDSCRLASSSMLLYTFRLKRAAPRAQQVDICFFGIWFARVGLKVDQCWIPDHVSPTFYAGAKSLSWGSAAYCSVSEVAYIYDTSAADGSLVCGRNSSPPLC